MHLACHGWPAAHCQVADMHQPLKYAEMSQRIPTECQACAHAVRKSRGNPHGRLSVAHLTPAGEVRAVAAVRADGKEGAGSGARALRHVGAGRDAAGGDAHRGYAPGAAPDAPQRLPSREGHCSWPCAPCAQPTALSLLRD